MATTELFQLAVNYHHRGDLAQAETLYRQILGDDPAHVDAFTNLGIVLQATGRGNEALACFQEALRLNPDHADGYNNLANTLKDQGQLDEAIRCYRQALRIDPRHANAHNNLGIALASQGLREDAIACFRQALRIHPQYANALNNLGNTLQDLGQSAEAIACFRQALQINPNHANALNNLGNALVGQGQLNEAIVCFQQALRIKPTHGEAHNNLGLAHVVQGQHAEAAHFFRQALKTDPSNAPWHINLGNALYEQGRIAEGDESYRQAIDLDPHLELARWTRSFQRLRLGDFEGGWEHFRHHESLSVAVPRYGHHARWNGEDPEGKTILVYVETADQCLGDTLQFARFLPLIRQRGARVVFECQPALLRLMTGFPGVDQLVGFGEPIPPFDYQIPVFHMMAAFRTTLSSIPAKILYLAAEPQLIRRWRTKMKPLLDINIGIAWQASIKEKSNNRSLPLAHFASLARVEGVRLFSLQVGPGTQQLAQAAFPIIDLGSEFDAKSMDDLAAAMMNLDLVVTVDTAVVHLAGALGRPVWVALPVSSEWRWLLDRSDSPWYPTMRLFRQQRFGDWDTVFNNIAEALRTFSPGSPDQA